MLSKLIGSLAKNALLKKLGKPNSSTMVGASGGVIGVVYYVIENSGTLTDLQFFGLLGFCLALVLIPHDKLAKLGAKLNLFTSSAKEVIELTEEIDKVVEKTKQAQVQTIKIAKK